MFVQYKYTKKSLYINTKIALDNTKDMINPLQQTALTPEEIKQKNDADQEMLEIMSQGRHTFTGEL